MYTSISEEGNGTGILAMLLLRELGMGVFRLKRALGVGLSSSLYKLFITCVFPAPDTTSCFILVSTVGAVALLPTCKCNWYG